MPRGGFEAGRLFGPDLARGIALLGMLAAHVDVDDAEDVYDGRSAILFATVAGVSLGLLTGGARPRPRGERAEARAAIALRALALIVLGVILTLAVDPPLAVILDSYGFAFLLMLPVLFAPRTVLVLVAAVVVLVMPPLVGWLRERTDPAAIPDLLRAFTDWTVYGAYPMAIWIAFLIAGLLCARSDLARRRTQVLLTAGGAAAALLGYGVAALLPGVTAEAHSGSAAEVIGSGGVAVAVVGAATLVGDLSGAAGRGIRTLLFPVAAAGAMALTLYTAHALVLSVVRGLGSEGSPRWDYPEPTLGLLIAGVLLVATAWRHLLGAGPLERLLRLLTGIVRSRPAPPRV